MGSSDVELREGWTSSAPPGHRASPAPGRRCTSTSGASTSPSSDSFLPHGAAGPIATSMMQCNLDDAVECNLDGAMPCWRLLPMTSNRGRYLRDISCRDAARCPGRYRGRRWSSRGAPRGPEIGSWPNATGPPTNSSSADRERVLPADCSLADRRREGTLLVAEYRARASWVTRDPRGQPARD